MYKAIQRKTPPVSYSPTIQRIPSRTKVKDGVGRELLKHYREGTDIFLPDLGNFGRVSWFSGKGSPYVGGQAQAAPIVVDVDIDEVGKASKTEADFHAFIAAYKGANAEDDISQKEGAHNFWKALGTSLEANEVTEVDIPGGIEVNRRREDAGSFYTVNAAGSKRVTLTNPVGLGAQLGETEQLGPLTKVRLDFLSLKKDIENKTIIGAIKKHVTDTNPTENPAIKRQGTEHREFDNLSFTITYSDADKAKAAKMALSLSINRRMISDALSLNIHVSPAVVITLIPSETPAE